MVRAKPQNTHTRTHRICQKICGGPCEAKQFFEQPHFGANDAQGGHMTCTAGGRRTRHGRKHSRLHNGHQCVERIIFAQFGRIDQLTQHQINNTLTKCVSKVLNDVTSRCIIQTLF